MECDLHYLVTQGRLHARHRKYLVYQLLLGLKYIHSASLLHRDLKPSNLLVNSACLLKIADFGLVRTLEADNEDELLTQEVATRWYRAPEVLLGSRSYSFPADLWSVGCIVGELLLGRPLFQGDSTRSQL
jgi:mitogen-activated protein kinase 15